MSFNYTKQVIYEPIDGRFLQINAQTLGARENVVLALNGTNAARNQQGQLVPQPMSILFDEKMLSMHTLMVGAIGMGKTNAFNHMIAQVRQRLTKDDIVIIFDTKADFLREFYRAGDIVISPDRELSTDKWNIFGEVTIDGEAMIDESILEIAKTLFNEKIEKSQQPFFPTAAMHLFTALVQHFARQSTPMNNKELRDFIFRSPISEIKRILDLYDDTRGMTSYIQNENSNQTQGVISEMQQLVREIFVGTFAEAGNVSIRQLVRNRGAKTVFIEYDMSRGNMLTPIYRLLIDLAIKEALGRSNKGGNVYFFIDEFKLLPYMEHIDDGVNFGRSLGTKFFIGVQNIEQIFDAYGEYRARSILSGFTNIFAFRPNDYTTRNYIKETFGQNRVMESFTYSVVSKGRSEIVRDSYVVQDKDMDLLDRGQAIARVFGYPVPFVFKFNLYQPQK